MKMVTLWAFALAALPLSPLSAQSLTGTWQGTLQDGKDLRIVFKISTSEKDALKGIMYNVDQDPLPLPCRTAGFVYSHGAAAGAEMEAAEAAVDVLVIDHLEKPSEN